MRVPAQSLAEYGYITHTPGYRSTRLSAWTAARVVEHAFRECRKAGARRVHVVTHSLGALLLRCFLQDHAPDILGRIVMLAPPNQGSPVADRFRHNLFFRFLLGPAGRELGTGKADLPRNLRTVPGEIGIIAGSKSSDPWFAHLFNEPNDGKVSVAAARLPEMKEMIVLPYGHTFLMNAPEVVHQILFFLRHARFDQKSARNR